jgi:predicted hydrocarbon binding protein/archaellum biogenesis ATPase FlaH
MAEQRGARRRIHYEEGLMGLVSISQLQEVPSRNLILLVGPPGAGKSTFCQETVLKSITTGPVIYVTTESTPSEILESFRERGLGEDLPHPFGFVDAFRETVGLPRSARPDVLDASCGDLTGLSIAISKMRERVGESALLVFDSLTSPYLMNGSEVVKFIRTTLLRLAVEGNAVLTSIDEGCGRAEDLVAMMSLSNGIMKIEMGEDSRFLNLVKHPRLRPTRIELPMTPSIELRPFTFDRNVVPEYFRAQMRKDKAWFRSKVGDFVNLLWPNLAHWSGMLWDPKRFPTVMYEVNKQEPSRMTKEYWSLFPWRIRFLSRLYLPKSFGKVKEMKRMARFSRTGEEDPWERNWIGEYLEDISKTDEHYFRLYESYECWGFEKVGAATASHFGPEYAGMLMAFEKDERDWNAMETKCIGLGDPYCEFKVVPGEIDGLKASLEKDSSVVGRIHERLMDRFMGFLIHGKPLVERPRLGSDIHIHPVCHAMGFPHVAGERYRMGLRMGGAKSGKEMGERLLEAEIGEDEAVKRVLNLLGHCKVGKVTAGETIRMEQNCESTRESLFAAKQAEPSCYFTTGFLNGFFSAVTNQHVRETKCIGVGEPYCEWEFR